MKDINELLFDVPNSLIPMTLMEIPNSPIPIYNGKFSLGVSDAMLLCEGTFALHWLPSKETRVEFQVLEPKNLVNEFKNNSQLRIVINEEEVGELIIVDFVSNNLGHRQYFGHVTGDFTIGQKENTVDKIVFEVPNLKKFTGEGIKEGTGIRRGRLSLESDSYLITLDEKKNIGDLEKKLKSIGGFLLLYTGVITKKNGAIDFNEAKKVLGVLYWFLTFINGRRTSPMFLKGMAENNIVWENYNSCHVDQYKNVWSWSPDFHLDGIKQSWRCFLNLSKNQKDFDCLTTAIHWYAEANKGSGYAEGAIMMSQNALELLYNWQVIEKRKIIKDNGKQALTASNKIRLLLFTISQSYEIPDDLFYLKRYAGSKDGPETITEIRNAIVHGNEHKRNEISNIPGEAIYQAMQLGIFYIELILLKIVEYKGGYINRCVNSSKIICEFS